MGIPNHVNQSKYFDIRTVINEDTFVISDQHFGHEKIVAWENSREARRIELGYASWEEMLIDKHNSVVGQDDNVLFLGDFSFKSPGVYAKLLNGKKHLILGNHDRKGINTYEDFDTVIKGLYAQFNEFTFIYSDEDELLSAAILEIDGKSIGFSHYSAGWSDVYDEQNTKIRPRSDKIWRLFDMYSIEIVVHGHLHSKVVPDKYPVKYHNVSCEHLDFTPIRIKDLLNA